MSNNKKNEKIERRRFLKVGGLGALLGGVGIASLDRTLLKQSIASIPAVGPSSTSILSAFQNLTGYDVICFIDSNSNANAKDGSVGNLIVSGGNITSYGAGLGAGTVGAASTTAAISEALNCLKGSGGKAGGVVKLNSSFFPSTTTINVYSGMALVGAASSLLSAFLNKGTCAIQPGTFNTPVIQVLVDPANTTDLVFPYLEGFAINGVSPVDTAQDGIFFSGANGIIADCFVEKVGIFNVGGNGVNINTDSGGKYWLHGYYAENNLQNGVLQQAGLCRIEPGYFFQNTLAGIKVTGTITGTKVIGCEIRSNTSHGIFLTTIASPTYQLIGPDNEIDANGGNGIQVVSCNGATSSFKIFGNTITNSVLEGLLVNSCATPMSIYGNDFVNNGNNTHAAVHLQQCNGQTLSFLNNVISENRAAGSRAQYGIFLDAGSGSGGGIWALVSGNNVTGTYLTSAINLSNASSRVAIRNNFVNGVPFVFGLLATPYGNTIANPFGSNFVGYGGSATTPTTGVTYKANEPVDVTIAAGTGQTITTKDEFGNIIDNAVATLSHRLLRENYTIIVTATGVGVTTVVQASIGLNGTSAVQQANVTYVVCGCDIFIDGGSVTAGVVKDGTSNTGGNTIDSGLTSLLHYFMPVGWNYSSTAVVTSPTITGN